jgi:Fur family peroxide stress response transcriptional regulator
MERFRDMGMKLTPQRLAILEFLEGNTRHPSAEEIFGAVKDRFPTMSFATVYNTLEALKARGKLLELTIDPARKRYDPNPENHHHLMCIRCGKIKDIFRTFELEISDKERGSYELVGSHVEFYGVCPKCG